MRTVTIIMLMMVCLPLARAADHQQKHYAAVRLTKAPPQIDGILDDEAWQEAVWDGDFIQHEPFEGRVASQPTRFAILYDEDNLFIAIRAIDSSPDSIVSRLTRRDQDDGDAVGIAFDSYYDLRTGFIFGVTAGGIRFDWIISNDGQHEDHSWDPNWWVKTHIDEEGWTAEMRIPFSQLRFEKDGGRLWGLQVFRALHRKRELSFWSHIPRDAPGLIHRFGTLEGMAHIDPRKIFDLSPYLVASTSRYPAVADNPFATGRDNNLKLGLDSKIGLSNHFTLDMTINPDFGQVEADPSEVNLTAFETFFEEKRPFFIEGKNIMSFNLGVGNGGIGNDNLFYSRRIGRRPQGSIHAEDDAYVDRPNFTNILGAAKVSGKTREGLSVAVMQTVTADTKAAIDLDGHRSSKTIEPLSNFFVGRVQKDHRDGNTILGGMLTAVNRRLDDHLAAQMHRAAYSGGIDFTQYFRDKAYMFNLNAAFSHVAGEKEAILQTQKASARYFQCPDDGMMKLDTTLTALTGTGGRVQFGKFGDGHWNFMAAMLWKSPSFEINDMGYMREADQLFQVFWVGYHQWEPRGFYRTYRVNLNQYTQWSFAGDHMLTGANLNGSINFQNYWNANAGIEYNQDIMSKSLLRGGPMIRLPDLVNTWLGIGTDNRRKFVANINGRWGSSMEDFREYISISPGVTYKPGNAVNLSVHPSYSKRTESMQYVKQTSYGTIPRYVFGLIDQEVLSFSFRLNLTVLPDLTLQYWGQPFIAGGSFSEFKYILDPRADRLADRYVLYADEQLWLADGTYHIDENLDGIIDYQFSRPDFRVREFLSNLVVRWEYSPGSSLYIVWSQDRSSSTVNGHMDYVQELDYLFDEKPRNTFLIKYTYRIGVK